VSRPICVIRSEFELERDRLVRMDLSDPGILEQSQLVDLLHVELIRAERALARAS